MTQMRRSLLNSIDSLKEEVTKMANLVVSNIHESLKAFINNDIELATLVVVKDEEVDRYEEEIAKQALKILWKEQPLAGDLRLVTGILKLITDLERIGDHAIDIAEITIKTANLTDKRLLPLITKMTEIAQNMVLESIESLFKIDVEQAKHVIIEDDKVDQIFNIILENIVKEIKADLHDPHYLVYLLMVAKYIERIGDHAVNICEWIIFIESGSHKKTSLFWGGFKC